MYEINFFFAIIINFYETFLNIIKERKLFQNYQNYQKFLKKNKMRLSKLRALYDF